MVIGKPSQTHCGLRNAWLCPMIADFGSIPTEIDVWMAMRVAQI
jgi:hypothetical protein